MTETKGKHLSIEKREVIADGLNSGKSARHIAAAIDVAVSTVTHEVKKNRTITEPKRRCKTKLSTRCAQYRDCQKSGTACKKCSTQFITCKHCKTRNCIDHCSDFELAMCSKTIKWPYVCPLDCTKRKSCTYPKCRYSAATADALYHDRLVSSREGINLTQGELEAMSKLIVPLVRKGQSYEAIWATHADELHCSVRTAYSYQAKGLFHISHVYLPRKVRIKKRKTTKDKGKTKARERVDRTDRTYDDFKQLPLVEQVCVVQCDSVEGYEKNNYDVLSMHIVARAFQLYLYKMHGQAQATVAWFDYLERLFGSCDAFEAVFGLILADRGVEFDDWEGMERSCLESGRRRCRVFYCDAMNSNQKSQAERNHEQLRRILPKGRSDFDKLNVYDVAVCCSQVNSYPSAGRGGKCPFELLGDFIPKSVLDELGLERIAPDEVVLKPSLMRHAVEQ